MTPLHGCDGLPLNLARSLSPEVARKFRALKALPLTIRIDGRANRNSGALAVVLSDVR
jgi:hypothetical protein